MWQLILEQRKSSKLSKQLSHLFRPQSLVTVTALPIDASCYHMLAFFYVHKFALLTSFSFVNICVGSLNTGLHLSMKMPLKQPLPVPATRCDRLCPQFDFIEYFLKMRNLYTILRTHGFFFYDLFLSTIVFSST